LVQAIEMLVRCVKKGGKDSAAQSRAAE